MRKRLLGSLVISTMVALAFAVVGSFAADAPPQPAHHAVQSAALVWGPAPPVLGAGAMMAVVHGDPGAEVPYVLRLKLPAGFKVTSHWHPSAENVTVLSGSLGIGAGDNFDRASSEILAVGGFVSLPALMHHFAWAETAAEIQIHGNGPFALFYLRPADDPTAKPKG